MIVYAYVSVNSFPYCLYKFTLFLTVYENFICSTSLVVSDVIDFSHFRFFEGTVLI